MSEQNKRNPWQQRKSESMRSFMAFEEYRQLGPARTLQMVEAATGLSEGALRSLSSRHNWQKRARAWDDFIAGKASDSLEFEAKRLAQKHLDALDEMRTRGLELIQLDSARPSDGVSMLKFSISMERLAMGEATERLEVRNATWDLSGLTSDELKLPGAIGENH